MKIKHLVMGGVAVAVAMGIALKPTPQRILPDPALTPGLANPDVTQENLADNICNPQWTTRNIRPPVTYTSDLKKKQIKQYGYKDINPPSYEEDHLVALTDGGDPKSPSNLWPEPINSAKEKDRYELYVHRQICNGVISLAEGQKRLATNWYYWYKQSGLDKQTFGSTLDPDDL